MLRSSSFFLMVALPYQWLSRHPVWERHCARMAEQLPAGARRVLDLGCGPGNSAVHLGPGAIGGDHSLAMLRLARPRPPRPPLGSLAARRLPLRHGALDPITLPSVL